MALEPITRQEQIIAGKDLEPITRMEKFLKQYGGSGGGSIPKPLTYDYMPEGYPKKGGWSIEWDGNTEGKVAIAVGGQQYYKFSDMVPSAGDLFGAKVIMLDPPGTTGTITSDNVTSDLVGDVISININIQNPTSLSLVFLCASKDNAYADGITFPEKGLYVDGACFRFMIAKETITPMLTDFIPMAAVLNQVQKEYFANTDLQISGYPDAQAIQEFALKNNSYGVSQPGEFGGKVLSAYNDTTNQYLTVVLAGNNKVECRKTSNGSTDIEQLWSIQKDGVIISSSTPDSTKKFKITVDDSGTISATEVTQSNTVN